ncbi:MAG: hypothetical protein ABI639_06910 [Thermoanaerobaculia bacterium]
MNRFRNIAIRSWLGRRNFRAALLLTGVLGAFYYPLLEPGAVLATRDLAEYHLPMRVAFARLANFGLPQWDPFSHGGQPLLSNPNYGALYPLSWLAAIFAPATALNILVLIHAALAAWGALRLARRLGANDAAAALAAVAYACGPTYLSLLHTLTIALAMSFLPWVIDLALAELDDGGEDARGPGTSGTSRGIGEVGAIGKFGEIANAAPVVRRRPSWRWLALSFAMATMLLLGDPLLVAMMLLALAAFVFGKPRARLAQLPRLATAFALALLLAAVQLLPSIARLADSPRAAGLGWKQSTAWSLPWQRIVELLFPTFFGDSTRPELALFFGWGIHDRDYPYLILIAVSLPLLFLSLASWTRRDSPERASFALMSLAGIFLALGRHNPLYRWAWSHFPGIDKLRFPEKFLLLALIAAIFSGALAWQRLLDERDRRQDFRAPGAELPAALAAVLVLVAAGLTGLAFEAPQLVAWFARAHTGLPLVDAALARALVFYRHEGLAAVGFACGTLALFACARFSRLSRRTLEGAALALVALELWTYGHSLLRTVPGRDFFAPPRVASELPATTMRLFSDEPYRQDGNDVVVTGENASLHWARAPIERLDSRAGNLFGYAYALDKDFDLSLTRPARRALHLYERVRERPTLALHLLGAWSVSHLVERKSGANLIAEVLQAGPPARARSAPDLVPVRIRENGFALPPYRFVEEVRAFPDAAAAEAAAVADALPLNRVEYVIATPAESTALTPLLPARPPDEQREGAQLRGVQDRGDRIRIAFVAPQPALLVIASTFDDRWQARSGGRKLPIYETAAGYMALIVRAGESEVELRFRDPWVSLGGAITATALLSSLLAAVRAHRLRRKDRRPGSAA